MGGRLVPMMGSNPPGFFQMPEMSYGSKGCGFAGGACEKRIGAKAEAARGANNAVRRCVILLLLLGLGPLAVVWRDLNFNRRVAWLYRKCVHVDSLSSHAAPAAAAQPLAIGNEHKLSASAESPVALGRNEAHQELVPKLECVFGPSIPKRVSRTYRL